MEEIIIDSILLSTDLSVRETAILEELFMLRTEPAYTRYRNREFHKYDCNFDSRIKEIVCTFKQYFLNSFKNPNDSRWSWVKYPKHHITRILKKLTSTNSIQIKYNRFHKSLILYKQ